MKELKKMSIMLLKTFPTGKGDHMKIIEIIVII